MRGALGDPVCALLVNLQLRLPGVSKYTGVTCVVCEVLNLDLILVADIVRKLNLVRNKLSNVSDVPDMVDVDVDVVNVKANNAIAAADDTVGTDHQNDMNDMNDSVDKVLNGDDVNNLINDDDDHEAAQSTCTSNFQQIIKEQHEDRSLTNCWSLAKRHKAGYFVRDNILYRKEKILGQEFEQLCLPKTRKAEAIKLAHQVGESHLAAKKTKERLKLSFTWPTIAADVTHACPGCILCALCGFPGGAAGVPPWMLVCERLTRKPLAMKRESWRGLENADPMLDIINLLQRVGRAEYICFLAVKNACWQITVYPDNSG